MIFPKGSVQRPSAECMPHCDRPVMRRNIPLKVDVGVVDARFEAKTQLSNWSIGNHRGTFIEYQHGCARHTAFETVSRFCDPTMTDRCASGN